jgi:hypothetical protein
MAANPIAQRIRSLEQALADLLAKHHNNPSPELARMIRQLEMEIAERKGIRRDARVNLNRTRPSEPIAAAEHRIVNDMVY